MGVKVESTGIGGAVFACCMMVALAVVNLMFAVYITPVFAEAAGAGIPAVILYLLNWLLIPLVTLAAIYSIYRVYAFLRAGMADHAMANRIWALGLAVASVALFAVQLFIALACVAIWMPGPAGG